MRSMNLRACALVATFAWSAASASAATITSANLSLPGASTGTIGPLNSTPAPNDDNENGPSPNAITATWFLNAQGFGVTDLTFLLAASGGTTEYRFTQTMTNNTGVPWTDFHFQLGFGSGAAFVPAPVGTGLDFDWPDADPPPTSTAFPAPTPLPTTIDWAGATVWPVGQGTPLSVTFTFAIDVPDGLRAVHPGGLEQFTLRQFPTATTAVPEPGTLALVGLGLACAGRWRSRPRRRGDGGAGADGAPGA